MAKNIDETFLCVRVKWVWDQRMPKRLAGRFDREFNRLRRSRHQHLSYILGYNAILETKTKLIEELGSGFDEKKFHDAIFRLEHKEPAAFYKTIKVAMKIPNEHHNTIDTKPKS